MTSTIDIEQVVNSKYGLAAQRREEELCCPVEYDTGFLDAIPEEIREKDHGCGNPSSVVREGDVVLDLGSGAGKICYIAAQIVGPHGRVIGVDANDAMLALAEKYKFEIELIVKMLFSTHSIERHSTEWSSSNELRSHGARFKVLNLDRLLWRRTRGNKDHAGSGTRPSSNMDHGAKLLTTTAACSSGEREGWSVIKLFSFTIVSLMLKTSS